MQNKFKTLEEIGKTLQAIKDEKKWSQDDIAEQLDIGINRQTVSKLTKGKCDSWKIITTAIEVFDLNPITTLIDDKIIAEYEAFKKPIQNMIKELNGLPISEIQHIANMVSLEIKHYKDTH